MSLNKTIRIMVLSLAILSMGEQNLVAQEDLSSDEIYKEVMNNVSYEFVTCSAFYFFCSEAFRLSDDLENASKYEEYRNNAATFALTAAKKGRTQEMAEKVTLARLDLEMKSMTNEIENDISNISILMNKHLDHCEEIMTDPEKIMNKRSDKILKKHLSK